MKMSAIKLRRGGFTVIELLAAMTVFLIVIGISGGIFIHTIRTQRIITNMSASLNNVTLALEQIAREARTGYNFEDTTGEPKLVFKNAQGKTVEYSLPEDGGQIMRKAELENPEPITSETTNISQLQFRVTKETIEDRLEMPALITISATVKAEGDIEVHLQTSVSSRIIKI
jgi:prepilin-type N-terminal cleavage/methylation domain-containing protein